MRRPPRSTRTDTLFPYTTLFRSARSVVSGFVGVVLRSAGSDQSFQSSLAPVCLAQQRLLQTLAVSARSEEHTSELQSLMRTSYAAFCLKKKTKKTLESPSGTSSIM